MSEHYDFHYQPTGSGAISGQQVLQQTEDAINELGDYVNDNVGGAMDVAQQALETAQNAEQDAQTALDTANSFSSAIQSAQQDASTALSTAQTAQNTASNANNTAIQAQQDASSAVTTANNASGQVSTLSGTVTALGQRVTTAEGNIGQNTSDITALTTRVGTAEGNITTLQNDVSIAQGNASSAMATAGTVKQQAYVFRYSSTALVASSTNSNTLLDNTDNLKVGDKVIDSSGVLFSITAIDNVNSTFTIGTALVDLAQDSDVVHKSGNETVAGFKEFANIRATNSIKAINLENTTTDLNNCYSDYAPYGESRSGNIQYYYCNTESGIANISNLPEARAFFLISITTRLVSNSLYVKQILINSNSKTFVRYCNNSTWSSWVNETDSEYVHKSGDEGIIGSKTFGVVQNFTGYPSIRLYSTDDDITVLPSSSPIQRGIRFTDKNNNLIAYFTFQHRSDANEPFRTCWRQVRLDGTDGYYSVNFNNLGEFYPENNNGIKLGTSTKRWKDCQTYLINGLTPSSLSLPDIDNRIDISSYITDLNNVNNEYTPSVNGWICVRSTNANKISIFDSATNIGNTSRSDTATYLTVMTPVIANRKVYINVVCTSLAHAYFIPCQGNV